MYIIKVHNEKKNEQTRGRLDENIYRMFDVVRYAFYSTLFLLGKCSLERTSNQPLVCMSIRTSHVTQITS